MKNEINQKNQVSYLKYRYVITLTILITLLFFSLSTISAANITITDSHTGGIAQGIRDTGVGDTLFLQPDTYMGNNNTNMTINKSITIQGNGSADSVIIDAQKNSRIFFINNNSIKFINITFINGNITSDGAAINNNNFANITVINCEFTNNTASSYGGAICNEGPNFTVINCTFTNSISTGSSNSGDDSKSRK